MLFEFQQCGRQMMVRRYDAVGDIEVEVWTPRGEFIQTSSKMVLWGDDNRVSVETEQWWTWIGGTMLAEFHFPMDNTPRRELEALATAALQWLNEVAPSHARYARQRWDDYLVLH